MNKTTIHIKGMHCKSCELLVEDELLKIPGVQEVKVNQPKGTAELCYCTPALRQTDLKKAVKAAGYTLGKEEPKPWLTKNVQTYLEIATVGFVLVTAYIIADGVGLFKLVELSSNNFASLPIVFLIGLTAGISTCAALVGGLVLAASARYAESNPNATTAQKFQPHIFFNIGRVLSFFVLGGLIGWVGSLFQMSFTLLGLLTIAIGMIMIFFGLQLTELSPRLNTISFTLPSGLSKLLGLKNHAKGEYSHKQSMTLGALTFFLPCGFTQVVQLYAISTGNPLTAALTMGIFALGTTPGLLGIGGITSLVKGGGGNLFFKFAGVVVIALAVFNISNGMTLGGFKPGKVLSATSPTAQTAIVSGDIQLIKTTYTSANDIVPNQFTVKVNQPVRMEIEVKDDGFGCMGSMVVPAFDTPIKMLKKGETIVYEFTPTKTGTFDIACAMGVPRGTITVI